MARIDKIKQALKELSPVDKISLHNIRSRETGNYDDEIYENDEEFFNMNYPNNPHEAVRASFYGDFRYMDEYISLADNGNLVSFEERDLEKYIDDNLLAEYFDENPEELDDLEIEEEEPNEVSEDRYYDSLGVLPPIYFSTLNGKNVKGGFAVSEPNRHISTPDGFKATYNGFYKKDGKYFEIGEVYFVNTDADGEADEYGGNDGIAKTVNPEAFGLGGIFRKIFGSRKVQTGRAWTNDHYHHNKSEDYEIPMANRKHFAKGGGVREHNGREYSFGRAWTNDHRHQNLEEDYEVEMYDRKRKFEDGGEIIGRYNGNNQYYERPLPKIIIIHGSKINDVALAHLKRNTKLDFKKSRWDHLEATPTSAKQIVTLLVTYNWKTRYYDNWDYKNELHLYLNVTDEYANGGGLKNTTYIPNRDIESLKTNYGKTISGKRLVDGAYAKGKLKTPKVSRTQFEEETFEYKTGGKTPKQPIAFEHSNLYFNGYGIDINGNKVVRVSFPNSRAFSIQTNGTLPKTYKAHGSMEFDEAEINAYVKEFGSPAQKKKLKIYKK
jgi:hypothetical protein